MPCVSSKQYAKQHRWLRWLWMEDRQVFTVLLPAQQWVLHTVFQPDRDLTDAELLAYRKLITEQCPELPQRAGRGLGTLGLILVGKARPHHGVATAGDRQRSKLGVRSLARPEVDADKLARAFWEVAQRVVEQDDDAGDQSELDE